MPIRLNFVERTAFHRMGAGPVPLLDVFGAYAFRVLVAGLRLSVFDRCGEPRTSADLAADLGVDAGSLTALLEALEAIGYLEKTTAGWVNTTATERWLVADDQTGVRAGVEYWAKLLDGPLQRPDDNLTSTTERSLYEWLADDLPTADLFQAWMVEVARLSGPELLRRIPRGSIGARLLDVGGGHGWYSIELCRRHPALRATIVDRPSATRRTRDRLDAAGLGDRIDVVDDDYTTFEAGTPYPTVLMFNVLHGHRGEELDRLLVRSRSWVRDDGCLLILEQFPDAAGFPATTVALLNVAYDQLLGGRAHDFAMLRDALAAAGYRSVRRRRLRLARGTSLVVARP